MKILSKIALLVCLVSFVACASTNQNSSTDQTSSVDQTSPADQTSSANKEYMDFFKQYESLGHAFDASVADMYSDKAVVRAIQKMPDGMEQTTKVDGHKWKEMITSTMEISKQRGDKSEFSNISVSMDGDVAKITASRYSTIKCFMDEKYYMRVEKQSDGTLKIIEEYVEIPVETSCKTAIKDDVELFLKGVVAVANKQYPIMVDSDTKLERASSEGKTLIYHYTLVNYAADELNAQIFEENMMPNLLQQSCTTPSLRSLVDKGGTVTFQYNGKDQKNVSSMEIRQADCLRLANQT